MPLNVHVHLTPTDLISSLLNKQVYANLRCLLCKRSDENVYLLYGLLGVVWCGVVGTQERTMSYIGR